MQIKIIVKICNQAQWRTSSQTQEKPRGTISAEGLNKEVEEDEWRLSKGSW